MITAAVFSSVALRAVQRTAIAHAVRAAPNCHRGESETVNSCLVTIGLVAVCVSSGFFAASALADEAVPSALVCDFQSENVAAGSLAGLWEALRSGDKFTLTFAAINPREHNAQLIGNLGTSSVQYIRGEFNITFIEVTLVGNVNSTSVLLSGWKDGPSLDSQSLPAVHSRHVGGPQELLISQYEGTCEPKF